MMSFALIALLQASLAAQLSSSAPQPQAAQNSTAANETDTIEQVLLGPLFRQPYFCMEHPAGQLEHAGDALGTDCLIAGGLEESGFMRLFRTDGATNDDWYAWHADVLAPVDGVVDEVILNPEENVPGTPGKPPAGMISFHTSDDVIVVYAHVTDIRVRAGDKVETGRVVGLVGNNGYARAPHIHVGAYRETDGVALQIRWNLKAMGRLSKANSANRDRLARDGGN